MKTKIQTLESPIGRLGLVAATDGKRLREIYLPNTFDHVETVSAPLAPAYEPVATALLTWLDGGPEPLRLEWLDMDDFTDFRRRVSLAAYAIPRGQTLTYGQLAVAAQSPRAARAVGRVMATNPFPLVIPCHRVVGADGLHGFGGGLPLKARLLAIESA